MRHPTRSEYKQLKAQGFVIEPIMKDLDYPTKLLKDKEFLEKYALNGTTNIIVKHIPHGKHAYSLDKLYELGVLK